jgi:hypothetical protein
LKASTLSSGIQWSLVAEVRQHRHLGLARGLVGGGHAAAVIGDRGAQAVERAGRAPGQQAAVAVADDADLAGLRRMLDRGLDVLHHARRGQRLDRRLQRHAGRHVVLLVAQFHAGLDAVERGRRHGQEAFGRIAVGDGRGCAS